MDSCDATTTFDDGADAMVEPIVLQLDVDGDGFAETTIVDIDGNGLADAVDVVDVATGAAVTAIDVDLDGTFDEVLTDSDGDGTFDVDEDGNAEVYDTTIEESEIDAPFEDDLDEIDDEIDDVDVDDDSDVHGDPMEEIPYHQAQVGPNDCLPTSVAMVLSEVTGEHVPQDELVDLATELSLLGPKGMSLDGGVTLLEHHGVDAEVRTGTTDELRTMLDAGKPVIIGLDSSDLYGVQDAPFADDLAAGHAVVITGIDDEAGLVYINDPGFPDGAGVAIPIETFEDAWKDADFSMIVAVAPDGAEDADEEEPSTTTVTTDTGDLDDVDVAAGGRDLSLIDAVLLPFNLIVR